jgi:phosphate transport system substrate-binding protein
MQQQKKRWAMPYIAMQLFVVFVASSACTHKKQSIAADTSTAGTIHISVDETFKPVIDEQIAMYEGSFPGAKIIAHYKPEADCIRDLIRDTATRMVIVTRPLNSREKEYLTDSLGYKPIWDRLATDAIAIVVNKNSTDTLYTMERLKDQLSGKLKNGQTIVFDGLNATSTVRYATDSILKGEKFDSSVVRAVRSSKEVLEYVAANKNAIGLVGISWIGNPEIKEQVEMLNKVKLAYVKCSWCEDTPFVKPTQVGIMSRRYRLVRGLYYILKENYAGLGSGFVNFMRYERGQLIFRRAYLSPYKIGFTVRDVKINESLKKD